MLCPTTAVGGEASGFHPVGIRDGERAERRLHDIDAIAQIARIARVQRKLLDERPSRFPADHRVSALDAFAERPLFGEQGARHTAPLSALSGEDERHLGLAARIDDTLSHGFPAVGVGLERDGQLIGVGRQENSAMFERSAARLGEPQEVAQSGRVRRGQQVGDLAGENPKGCFAARRQRQQRNHGRRGLGRAGRRRRSLDDHVGVCARNSEAAYSGLARRRRTCPDPWFAHDRHRRCVPIHKWARRLEVQTRRDFAFADRQRRLDQAGNSRSTFRMADVGFN